MSRIGDNERRLAKVWGDMPKKFVRLMAKMNWRALRNGKRVDESLRASSEQLNKIIRSFGRPDKQIIFSDNREAVIQAMESRAAKGKGNK